jgi:hypothetical protein
MENLFLNNNEGGFMAFTSLLVVTSVALVTVLSVSFLGIGEVKSSLDTKKSIETRAIAESCVEEALLRTKGDQSFLSGSMSVGEGTCTISITADGSDKIIYVSAEIGDPAGYVKRIRVVVKQFGTGIVIAEWEEIS